MQIHQKEFEVISCPVYCFSVSAWKEVGWPFSFKQVELCKWLRIHPQDAGEARGKPLYDVVSVGVRQIFEVSYPTAAVITGPEQK